MVKATIAIPIDAIKTVIAVEKIMVLRYRNHTTPYPNGINPNTTKSANFTTGSIATSILSVYTLSQITKKRNRKYTPTPSLEGYNKKSGLPFLTIRFV